MPHNIVAAPQPVRHLILDAAAHMLSRRGYESTTLRGIADQVGIRAGSIYHHFPSKDSIVTAVMNQGVGLVQQAVLDVLASLPAGAGPGARIETSIRAHLRASLENSDYTSASIRAFAFLPPCVRENCVDARRAYEAIWQELIVEAMQAGLVRPDLSADALRLLLLGAVNWAGEWYRPGRLSVDEIAHYFTISVLDKSGLREF